MQRKIGKQVEYNSQGDSASDTEINKENQNLENVQNNVQETVEPKIAPKSQRALANVPKAMLDKKDFTSVTQKAAPKTLEEIDANMWKDNIK